MTELQLGRGHGICRMPQPVAGIVFEPNIRPGSRDKIYSGSVAAQVPLGQQCNASSGTRTPSSRITARVGLHADEAAFHDQSPSESA